MLQHRAERPGQFSTSIAPRGLEGKPSDAKYCRKHLSMKLRARVEKNIETYAHEACFLLRRLSDASYSDKCQMTRSSAS